jgi:hypothetical protein
MHALDSHPLTNHGPTKTFAADTLSVHIYRQRMVMILNEAKLVLGYMREVSSRMILVRVVFPFSSPFFLIFADVFAILTSDIVLGTLLRPLNFSFAPIAHNFRFSFRCELRTTTAYMTVTLPYLVCYWSMAA